MQLRLTKREIAVAAIAAITTGGVFALAQAANTGILGATVYPWEAMTMSKTPIGEVRQVIKGPTATLEQLELHITTLDPGQSSHPPHHHPNEELILIREGTLETLSNGKWERIGPSSVIFNSTESWHSLRNVGTEPARYFVVNWRTPATDEIAKKNGQTQ